MDETHAVRMVELLTRWYDRVHLYARPWDEFEVLEAHCVAEEIRNLKPAQQRALALLARKCHEYGHSDAVLQLMAGYAAQVLRRRLLAIGLLP